MSPKKKSTCKGHGAVDRELLAKLAPGKKLREPHEPKAFPLNGCLQELEQSFS
jgi:hypothetical protein